MSQAPPFGSDNRAGTLREILVRSGCDDIEIRWENIQHVALALEILHDIIFSVVILPHGPVLRKHDIGLGREKLDYLCCARLDTNQTLNANAQPNTNPTLEVTKSLQR